MDFKFFFMFLNFPSHSNATLSRARYEILASRGGRSDC